MIQTGTQILGTLGLMPLLCFWQVQDVYTGEIISGLKIADNFTVIINPSGVVMWYFYPIMYLDQPSSFLNQLYKSETKKFHPFPLWHQKAKWILGWYSILANLSYGTHTEYNQIVQVGNLHIFRVLMETMYIYLKGLREGQLLGESQP